MKKTILLSLILFSFFGSFSQTLDSKGTDFWLMFTTNAGSNPRTLILYITSEVATSGSVSIPGLGFSAPFTVTANGITPVSIPAEAGTHTRNLVDEKGIHVTALQEVSIYGLDNRLGSTDAYLGLPTDVLGTDYVIMSIEGEVLSSEFGVIGTEDGTVVTITPKAPTTGHPANVPFTILLNKGQTFELAASGSWFNGTGDLTGTTLTSNHPIGVMGSNAYALIDNDVAPGSYITEMLPPANLWGQHFAVAPLKNRTSTAAGSNGERKQILAAEDGTIVTVDGVPAPPLNRGSFLRKRTASVIESNKPVLVAQFAEGQGSPFMQLVPPVDQFLDRYTVMSFPGFDANYINIVAPNAIVDGILLDGAAIPAASFTPIGTSGFSGAQISVTAGVHHLSGALPFGVFVYGFSATYTSSGSPIENTNSYGYPGGQKFAKDCTPPTFRNDLTIVLDASECGNDGLITIIPTSGTAPFMYSIDGGTTYVDGPATGYSFQGLAAGTYRLRLKDAAGCQSAVVTKEVRVLYPCTHCTPPTFRNDLTIVLDAFCGSPGLITIIPTSGTAPFQYSIDGGATYVEGPATGYSFQGLAAGTYTLRLRDATGCQSDPVQKTVREYPCEIRAPFVKGRDQQTAERALPLVVAYPNPSHGRFQVQLQRFASSAVHLQVLDSRGVVVEQKRVNAEQTRTVEVNLSNKAKGLYIIRVVSDKAVQTTKVIIQ